MKFGRVYIHRQGRVVQKEKNSRYGVRFCRILIQNYTFHPQTSSKEPERLIYALHVGLGIKEEFSAHCLYIFPK